MFYDSYNIRNVLNQENYKFLREAEYFKNIILLTYGGSISYGTNLPGSDIDIRGIALSDVNHLLGLPSIDIGKEEQYINNETDTTIYNLGKIFKLLINCNPNTIEMLYTRPEHQITNDLGTLLIENREIFLSQIAAHSFNGFAISQIHRLKNALSKDGKLSLAEELQYEKSRLNDMIHHFNSVYKEFEKNSIFFTTNNEELFVSCNFLDYPIEYFVGFQAEITSALRSWNKVGKLTEREKDNKKLNKHAMHIIRLYKMGIEILTGKNISTFRGDSEEHELLMKIRNGYFMRSDGTYDPVFFEIVNDFQCEFEYAKKHTILPEKCNLEAINELFISLNKKSLLGNKKIIL